jgi:hypothetical protein
MCAFLIQIQGKNAQKPHLCSFFGREAHENEQTLHNLEKSRLKMLKTGAYAHFQTRFRAKIRKNRIYAHFSVVKHAKMSRRSSIW